ncbi:MAG: DUF1080 domain-containing protein [Planctomycetaceae bacterium]|jgi:hypothetical protein|nr:DUF1080 domain-containing protein [Planctomycetaceae bacterium]
MKSFYALFAALFFSFCLTAAAEDKKDDGFVSLFNGKDLTNWEGLPDGWTVENGCIAGESTKEKPCKAAHYLYLKDQEPENFHFKIAFKLTGNGNSGVQIRSEKRPNWDTYGYQADVDASGQWTGCLFHHKRGAVVKRGFDDKIAPDGKVESHQFADPAELLKFYKPGDWNTYEIIADGSVITLIINGEKMCSVDDKLEKEAASKGIIALQMHPGPPMKIEFKDIYMKTLPKK